MYSYYIMKSVVLKNIKINKNENEVTTKIFNPNPKKTMTLTDVKNLTQAIKVRGENTFEFFDLSLIRILSGDRWATYNTMDDYLNYYEGKVKDTSKFENNVIQMQITTYQSEARK